MTTVALDQYQNLHVGMRQNVWGKGVTHDNARFVPELSGASFVASDGATHFAIVPTKVWNEVTEEYDTINYLYATGENSLGQCGNGSTTDLTAWKLVSTLHWLFVSTDHGTTIGVVQDGYTYGSNDYDALYGAGLNDDYQLGLGDTTDRTSFTLLTPLEVNFTAACTGLGNNSNKFSHAIGNGNLYSCGTAYQYELGDGNNSDITTWTAITSGTIFHQVKPQMALDEDGYAYWWGRTGGEEGTPTFQTPTLSWPGYYENLVNTFYAVDASGTLWFLGLSYPTLSPPNWSRYQTALGIGYAAYDSANNVYVYEKNGYIWEATAAYITFPYVIHSTHGWAAASGGNTVASTSLHQIIGKGTNGYGELVDGTTTARTALENRAGQCSKGLVTQFACGENHTLALINGKIYAAGRNNKGQHGSGSTDTDNHTRFKKVIDGFEGVTIRSIYACGDTSACLCSNDDTTDIRLYIWGDGQYGQLGNGGTSDSSTPVLVEVSGSALYLKAFALGNGHCLGIDYDDHLWAWGKGNYGQTFSGDVDNVLTPFRPFAEESPSEPDVYFVSAGDGFSLVPATAGDSNTYRAVGLNDHGQLGDGTTTNRTTYVSVGFTTSGQQGWLKVSSGAQHTFVTTRSFGVLSWGGNASGQLGNGGTADVLAPAAGAISGGTEGYIKCGKTDTVVLATNETLGTDAGQLAITSGNSFELIPDYFLTHPVSSTLIWRPPA